MSYKIDKDTLERNFSRYAHLYDEYSTIQRMAADRLIKEVAVGRVRNILEIGCGTGNYTRLLKDAFLDARLSALDISARMIEIAKSKFNDTGIEFIICDAEEVYTEARFDLITSNATFQWFHNFGKTAANYRNLLTEEGAMVFSTFGPTTFQELAWSIKKVLGDVSIASDLFLSQAELKKILKAHFGKVAVKEVVVKECYNSLAELLAVIKYTGVRGGGMNGAFSWKRSLLKMVESVYRKKFGNIEASYQIFFCKAVK